MKTKSLRLPIFLTLVTLVLMTSDLRAQETTDGLPDLGTTGVVIPWSDFKTLLADLRVQPTPTPIPPPPVDYAFSQCRIQARTDQKQEQLQLVMDFSIEILRNDRWVEARIAPVELALESVEMDGAPARLYRNGAFSCIALHGRARHTFTLKALVPVIQSQGRRWADLLYPSAPAALLNLTIPTTDLMITAEPGVSRGPEESPGLTRFSAALKGSGRTRISWFKNLTQEDKETTLFAESQTLLSVGEGSYHGRTRIAYTIHGKGMTSVDLELPEGLSILDLSGQGVAGWTTGEVREGRVPLKVTLDFQARGAWFFDLEFEGLLDGSTTTFDMPDIVVEGVRRERGFLALEAATNVELTPGGHLENTALVDPSEMPQSLASRAGADVLFVFKYLHHPVTAEISVTKHQDLVVKRSIAEQAHLVTFVSSQGRRLCSASFTLRNNRKQFLAATLPTGATLWGAFREGRPVKASQREDGAILIPLKKTPLGLDAQPAPFEVELVWSENGHRKRALGRHHFAAPSIDLDVLAMDWEIYLPPDQQYFAFGGDLEPEAAAQVFPDEARNAFTENDALLLKKKIARGDHQPNPIPDPSPTSQVAGSNVAHVWKAAPLEKAGQRGMLPVRVEVPRTGRLLHFSRRLVSPNEASTIAFLSAPKAWRLPRFTRWVTFLVTFVTALGLGLCLLLKAPLRWSILAGVLLVVLWLLSSTQRPAFLVALLPAALCVTLVHWIRSKDKDTVETIHE
jgi:hypothetical protein